MKAKWKRTIEEPGILQHQKKEDEMRVLYVYIGNLDEPSGVTKKLHGIFSELDKRGVAWTVFALSKTADAPGYISPNKYLLPFHYRNQLSKVYNELAGFMQKEAEWDLCFFRYPLAGPELLKFIRTFPGKFIFEHNTKEYPEVKNQAFSWVKKFTPKPTPSYFRLLWNTLIEPIWREARYAKKVLRHAKGGIAVTHEISAYESFRLKSYKCQVVSNGIELPPKPFANKRNFQRGDLLNLIFVVNSEVNWHGIDLVLESFARYNGGNIKLYLIGRLDAKLTQLASQCPHVIMTGFLKGDEFSGYLDLAHVGLGSFALYRKHLEEASTLKVREYWMAGLPVFLGHRDTDLINSEILSACSYYIDLRKKAINWTSVYDWAVQLYQNEALNNEIRAEAARVVGFPNKVDLLLRAHRFNLVNPASV